MKRIILLLALSFSMFLVNAQVPNDTGALRQKIITDIVPNGTKQITATQMRDILLGFANLIKHYGLDSGYHANDTLYLTRRGGYTTIKIYLPVSATAAETDPTVSNAAKTISQANIDSWNSKQGALTNGIGILLDNNFIYANNFAALWNAYQLQGRTISNVAPSVGQCLVWNGTQWAPGNCGSSGPTPFSITTDPLSQSIFEGSNVTFTVAASGGTTPYTYQWQKDAANIVGATSASYTFTTTSGSAGSYRAIVTDAANAKDTSAAATLTITTPIVVSYGYYTTDPYPTLSTGTDDLVYNATLNITNNADISVNFPSNANDRYWVVKVPLAQSLKVNWFNTSFNYGTIPDAVWQSPLTIGSFRYYVTRIAASLDSSQPVILQD